MAARGRLAHEFRPTGGGACMTSKVWPAFKPEAGRQRYLAAYEAAFAAWPVPCDALDVETSAGTTHVLASGDPQAPPLLLLPSFAATALVWRANVEALGAAFRVYAIDLIGQPGPSLARTRLRDRGAYARWLTEVMDALGVQRASIVGCSFGGFLALSQASLTPERVERVALISPAGTFVGMSWSVVGLMLTAR